MTLRRMHRKLRKALMRARRNSAVPNDPKMLAMDEPLCRFFGATGVDDHGWFTFQNFALALEEAFGINISDIEADGLYTGTIEEAIPWIRERMRNPIRTDRGGDQSSDERVAEGGSDGQAPQSGRPSKGGSI